MVHKVELTSIHGMNSVIVREDPCLLLPREGMVVERVALMHQLKELYAAAYYFNSTFLHSKTIFGAKPRYLVASSYATYFRESLYKEARVFRALLISGGEDADWEHLGLGIWEGSQIFREVLEGYGFVWEERATAGLG